MLEQPITWALVCSAWTWARELIWGREPAADGAWGISCGSWQQLGLWAGRSGHGACRLLAGCSVRKPWFLLACAWAVACRGKNHAWEREQGARVKGLELTWLLEGFVRVQVQMALMTFVHGDLVQLGAWCDAGASRPDVRAWGMMCGCVSHGRKEGRRVWVREQAWQAKGLGVC